MHVAADGDLVIPLVTIRALLRDGTPYANVYCFPMLFEDGKVVEMWEIHDTAYAFPRMRKQLMGGEG
jgi:ketosteroid isomerase-like protein